MCMTQFKQYLIAQDFRGHQANLAPFYVALPKLFVCQPWSPAIYKKNQNQKKTNKQKTLKKSQRPNFSLSQF